MFSTIITLLYVLYLSFIIGKMYGVLWAIVFWIIATFMTFVVFTLIHYLKRLIKKIFINAGFFDKFVIGFKKIVVPFIIVLIVFFLYEIYFSSYLGFLAKNYYNFTLSEKDIWISLIFTGIIPIRFILLFSYPIRVINITTFPLTFYYFFISISKILPLLY